ncbi:MAG: DNA mismatch repair protein MutL, partial [Betaproteobacteria bacterium]|nr:DNA mismatch repair protein MutL [Betaproteobacteria bacterium]
HRHATSKIDSAEDLQRLGSLGFRGEALAAIAAVADLSITSAIGDAAASVETVNGALGPVGAASRRQGTTVAVDRIFERLPARRKFQRAPSAESAYIGRLVQAYALAYPEIAFSLASDGRRIFSTRWAADLRGAVVTIFGPEVEREMLVLLDEREAGDGNLEVLGITGLVGSPDLHRATRNGLFFTVNRRPVDSRQLTFALEDAYTTQVPVGRHPVAIIDITVPPEELDVNIHPTKREVQLQRERLAFGILQQAVRATLGRSLGIPTIGSRPLDRSIWDRSEWSAPPSAPPFSSGSQVAGWEEQEGRPRLDGLRILGQIGLTYIICEGRAGLYLVDQHAAHERVLLERLDHRLGDQERAQLLLEPAGIAIPPALRGVAGECIEALNGLGFTAELLGESELVVRSVPAALPPKGIDRALQETLETLDAEGVRPDWRQRLAVLLSCKTAIKAGQHLEVAEMHALLRQLDEANLCATCSHGRPTAIRLSHAQLEREFGRR